MNFSEDNSHELESQHQSLPVTGNPPEPPFSPSALPVPTPLPYAQRPGIPEDLRISWSGIHFFGLLLVSTMAFVLIPAIIAIPYLPHGQQSPTELQTYLMGIPQFVIGSTLSIFGIVFLFLYVTLSVLPAQPFWKSLGWRKIPPTTSRFATQPWSYFLLGILLSVIVGLVGAHVKTPPDMPVEALTKTRLGLVLMLSLAVVIAPVFEETLFRGYLYPLIVRLVSASRQHFGAAPPAALETGKITSILLTGLLFGLLHGSQLSWTWGIVSLLVLVGIVFTYVRARTGTVLASFLMHLGYNSLLAVAALFETHGFTRMPPHP